MVGRCSLSLWCAIFFFERCAKLRARSRQPINARLFAIARPASLTQRLCLSRSVSVLLLRRPWRGGGGGGGVAVVAAAAVAVCARHWRRVQCD
jgi:hypothetical protein